MHILIIEDDREIARLTALYLQSDGYKTTIVADGSQAISTIKSLSPDLVMLDLMLPGLDGFEICKQARKFYTGPILVLTAKEDEFSEVSLLKLGADDYLRKPAKPHIMSARIEALLRRINNNKVNTEERQQLVIDQQALTVKLHDEIVELTTAEYELLILLFNNAGNTINRQDCIQALRGINYDISDRSIDMRISGLRKKLHDETPPYRLIKTVRNKGYVLINE